MSHSIVVTGATGFLGRHLVPILKDNYPKSKVVGLSHRDYDLLDPRAVKQLFSDHKPEVVVHLAAYSGGIGANSRFPADFFYRNSLLTTLVFQGAAEAKVRKMIYPMGGCSYPATATSPIDESQMWNGYPQRESAGYSVAKKTGIVASESYRTQYGLNSVVLIPGNMYGEYDNFRREESHVVPAMIRRYFEAELNGLDKVTMWGTGTPTRDFVYAADVARVIPWFIDNYDEMGPVNLSSGTRTTIKDLAESIREVVGYRGAIEWDLAKPDGQKDKIFAVKRLNDLGLKCATPLQDGLARTARWLKANYKTLGDGIRL